MSIIRKLIDGPGDVVWDVIMWTWCIKRDIGFIDMAFCNKHDRFEFHQKLSHSPFSDHSNTFFKIFLDSYGHIDLHPMTSKGHFDWILSRKIKPRSISFWKSCSERKNLEGFLIHMDLNMVQCIDMCATVGNECCCANDFCKNLQSNMILTMRKCCSVTNLTISSLSDFAQLYQVTECYTFYKKLVCLSFEWSEIKEVTSFVDVLLFNECKKLQILKIHCKDYRKHLITNRLCLLLKNNIFLVDLCLESVVYSKTFLDFISNCSHLKLIKLAGFYNDGQDTNYNGWVGIINKCHALIEIFAMIENGIHDATSLMCTPYDNCLQINACGAEYYGLMRSSITVNKLFLDLTICLQSILIEVTSITSDLLICIGEKHPSLRYLTIVDCSKCTTYRENHETYTFICLVNLYFRKCLQLEVLGLHEDRLRDIDLSNQFVIQSNDGSLISVDDVIKEMNYVKKGIDNRKICISVKHRFSAMFNFIK